MSDFDIDVSFPGKKPDAAARLGVEPVGKLLLGFSIPAITGMIVQAAYNLVDRVFVGRGVNEVALGGLALVMPLMTIAFAFSMLFGVGAANMISMRLGQKRRPEAENALNHCVVLLTLMGFLIMFLGQTFIKPLLSVLGAAEGSQSIRYAEEYYRIILWGQPFAMVSFGLSHCSRAQGFPLITMIGHFLGAGMNMILDPLFIFVFHWGVEGAAWATIISQCAAAVWFLIFNSGRKAVVRIRLKNLKPSLKIVLAIMSFGSAQFLLQFVMSGVQWIINTSIGWYGADSLGINNGGDIALSGMNIIMSLSMMVMMPIFGINQGAQPILGYNYGARQFARVRKTLLLAVMAAVSVGAAGLILGELIPTQLVRLFAPQGSAILLTFTPQAMRIIFMTLPLNGFQAIASNLFVVTGRPKFTIFLTLLRQVIFLIPCLLIFGKIWGLQGLVAASPAADAAAALVTGAVLFGEMRRLREVSAAQNAAQNAAS
jgi:putative MATE family efflux protein